MTTYNEFLSEFIDEINSLTVYNPNRSINVFKTNQSRHELYQKRTKIASGYEELNL